MSSDHLIYVTAVGFEKIEKEYERLRTVQRTEVADRIRDAKQFGEFTENAEYEEAKIEQAFVEGRIQELRRIIQNSHVVQPSEVPTDQIGIGSVVTVKETGTKDKWEFTLVGSVESDPDNDRISDESPVGEAMWGRKVGDQVDVATPGGHIRYRVELIRK